jgi:glycosyltransferase involved in cell wall biosynthesis
VIFVASGSVERTKDFVDLNCTFEYSILSDENFEGRNKLFTILKLFKEIRKLKYKRIVVGGWDLPEFWFLVFFSRKNKNCLALESTISESKQNGFKGFIKKIFLKRISMVFASGHMHKKLLDNLKYKGEYKITQGVGLINKPDRKITIHKYKRRFLFLGRLSKEKNLDFLITVFNSLPEYHLTIVGKGYLKEKLMTISKGNIEFFDHIENSKISDLFSNNDFLILPSISETWGLVVEEALYFGLPVLVSKNCGVSDLVQESVNGYIIDPCNPDTLRNVLQSIDTINYSKLLSSVLGSSLIDKKDHEQIVAYL